MIEVYNIRRATQIVALVNDGRIPDHAIVTVYTPEALHKLMEEMVAAVESGAENVALVAFDPNREAA